MQILLNISACVLILVYISSLRLLPHDNDTGGLFVAVITKLGDLPWALEGTTPQHCWRHSTTSLLS